MRMLHVKIIIAVGFLISGFGCSAQPTISSGRLPENQTTVSDQSAQNVSTNSPAVSPTPVNRDEITEKIDEILRREKIRDSAYDELKKLLALKPNLNVRDANNRSLLVNAMLSAKFTGSTFLKMLLEAGADPNFPSENFGRGCTEMESCLMPPMTIAFLDHNTEAMRLLIEHGADPNTGSFLAGATERDYRDMVKMLIAHKADVNYNEDYGAPGSSAILFVRSPETGKMLLDAGANINQQDESGQTALMNRISENLSSPPDPELEMERLKIVKFLIKNGADVNIKDKGGKSALQYALANKQINRAIIKELQKAGAK